MHLAKLNQGWLAVEAGTTLKLAQTKKAPGPRRWTRGQLDPCGRSQQRI